MTLAYMAIYMAMIYIKSMLGLTVRLKQLFIFSHSNSATLQPMTLDAQPMAALISLYPQTNRIDEDDLIKADNAYAASHG